MQYERQPEGRDLHATLKSRMEADIEADKKKPVKDPLKEKKSEEIEFDYSYLSSNSLYKNKNSSESNRLDYSVVSKGESELSNIGVSVYPSEVIEMKISSIAFGRKFEAEGSTVDELRLGKLFVGVSEFYAQSFSSHDGFKYHFGFNIESNPLDATELIATPINEYYNFSNPIRFDGNISFEFFTNKKYEFESDTFECYIDYSQPYITFYKVDGSDHNLSNLDIIYIENFEVPGIVYKTDTSAATHKSQEYRVSLVDNKYFEIELQLTNEIKTSINRPADASLGVYKEPVEVTVATGTNPTIITVPIPHGLDTGSTIEISSITRPDLSFMLGTWPVTVLSPTTFSVPLNTTAFTGTTTANLLSLPISTTRTNSVFVKIVTKKADFTLVLTSLSESAKNSLENIAE